MRNLSLVFAFALFFIGIASASWSAPMDVSNDTGAVQPAIAADAGAVYLAWSDFTPVNDEIFFSKSTDGGATWSPAVNVSNNDGDSYYSVIAVEAGTVYLAWQAGEPGDWDIFFSKSTDGGATWSAAVNVSNNVGVSVNPAMVVNAGTIHIAWLDGAPGNNEIFFSKSTDGGVTWSPAVNVSNNTAQSGNPAIALDAGTICLAWHDETPGFPDIFFSKSTDGGATWSTAVNVSESSGGSYTPAIAVDAGTIHLVWMDDTPGLADIFYSNSTDGGTTWSAPVNASNTEGSSEYPDIAIDAGTIHLTWHDWTSGNYDVLYSKSTDGGATWSAAENVSNNVGDSQNPTIAARSGTVYLAWDDWTPGASEIFYSKNVASLPPAGGFNGVGQVPESPLAALAIVGAALLIGALIILRRQ